MLSYVPVSDIPDSYEARQGLEQEGTVLMLLGVIPVSLLELPFCSTFRQFYTFSQECQKVALNLVYTFKTGPGIPCFNPGITVNNCQKGVPSSCIAGGLGETSQNCIFLVIPVYSCRTTRSEPYSQHLITPTQGPLKPHFLLRITLFSTLYTVRFLSER